MRDTEYRAWLETQELAKRSIGTKMSDARRVDQEHGDLDAHFEEDRMVSLLDTFAYSKADEAAGRANPTKLNIDGNLYNNLASYRAALTTYRSFCEARVHPEGRLSGLDRQAILDAIAACEAAGSVQAFIGQMDDRGAPHKFWLLHEGKRYPSKAIVHWAMRERGIDATAGGSLCKSTLDDLGFAVVDWPELQRAQEEFLRQMPDFSDFRANRGTYWDVERRYKNALIEQARTIAAGDGDDRAAGEGIYRILIGGQQGVPLNWRTLPEVQATEPVLRDRFYAALGALARSDAPLEEAIPAAARELEALRDAGITGLRRGEILSIPITVWATLHPEEASWFKIARIEEMGKRYFGRNLFPASDFRFREQDLGEWLQLMRALFGLLETEVGWHPQDLFDVQGFVWVALGGNDSAEDDGNIDEAAEMTISLDDGPYWFLGAAFGRTEDQLERFLAEGIWEISEPSDRHRAQVLSMQPGQHIAIKSTYTRKQGLPFDNMGRVVSVMGIKATGTITQNPGTGETVSVAWDPPFEAREWYHYTYQPTVWEVYPTKEMARRLIAFAFHGAAQDYDWFHANLKNWSQLPDEPEEEVDDELAADARQSDPQNIILYGPPGTGKTYRTMADAVRHCLELDKKDPLLCDAARREELRGEYEALRTNGQIAFVTFHQNFGYEDFVEGLRPKTIEGSAGFVLKEEPGIFRNMAEKAEGSPEQHVLVIDEINRANVSKVFGELITLIEPDKRLGKEEALRLRLPYSRKMFGVPANLHIIGTMNTADRSIALLDTALRRRFRFEEMAPDTSVPAFQQAETDTGLPLAKVLDSMNRRIEYLVDRDHRIGHAFFIGCDNKRQVDAVMRDKVIPLLQEYFFDDWSRLAAVLGEKDKGGNFLSCETIEDPLGEGDPMKSWRVRKEFDEGAYHRLVSGKAAPTPDAADPEADPA
ncbi:MAG: AAA family ATPase [Sphingomonadales bacterium]|nr:AAA family ATPase [Sphingomonadales bacterium]